MKEIFSAFGSEIFRPLATIVIPGAMALSVWFIVLLQKFTFLRALAEAHRTETAVLLALACIAAGLFVEDIGSRIESRCFDKWLGKATGILRTCRGMESIPSPLIGVTVCLLSGAVFYFYLTGRFAFLRRTPDWNVAVNGGDRRR
jgi:hypothetical protein